MELLTIAAVCIVIFLAVWPFIRRKNAYPERYYSPRKDELKPMEHEGVDGPDYRMAPRQIPGIVEDDKTVRVNVRHLTVDDTEKLANLFGFKKEKIR